MFSFGPARQYGCLRNPLGGLLCRRQPGDLYELSALGEADIAHPVFVIANACAAYMMNTAFGPIDPVDGSALHADLLCSGGWRVTASTMSALREKGEQSLARIGLFFGILYMQRLLLLIYGVDYRGWVEGSPTSGGPCHRPHRHRVTAAGAVHAGVGADAGTLFLGKTFYGGAIMGFSWDALACSTRTI